MCNDYFDNDNVSKVVIKDTIKGNKRLINTVLAKYCFFNKKYCFPLKVMLNIKRFSSKEI